MQGVRTGPALFSGGADIVYTFIFGLFLATILMLPVGLLIGRFAYRAIVRAPKAALVPIVAFMTVIGSFAIRNNVSDIGIMIGLGVIGWWASKRGFSVSAIVLGLILGRIAEQGFVQSWTIGDAIGDLWGQFFGRPLSMAIIALTVLSFLYPFWPQIKRLVARQPAPAPARAAGPVVLRDLFGLAIFGAIALVVIGQSSTLNASAAVFPRTVAIAMAVLVGIAALALLMTRRATDVPVQGSRLRMAAVPALMLGSVALIPILGFEIPAIMLGLALIVPAQHERYGPKHWIALIVGVTGVILGVTLLFGEVLGVPLP